MQNSDKGEIAEIEFILECRKRDLDVDVPAFGGHHEKDCVVNGKAVQVKYSSSVDVEGRFYFDLRRNSNIGYMNIDVFAIKIAKCKLWHLIPGEVMKGITSLRLRINKGKYNKYKGNWGIFNGTV